MCLLPMDLIRIGNILNLKRWIKHLKEIIDITLFSDMAFQGDMNVKAYRLLPEYFMLSNIVTDFVPVKSHVS